MAQNDTPGADKATDALLPCPFCDGQPTFSSVMEKDDRRYMQMNLECCVTMRETIGYGTYREMSEGDISTKLRKGLVADWNRRAAVAAVRASEPVAWMHDADGRVDVIHDQVKRLWLKVGQPNGFYREKVPCKVEYYTIPLYAAAPAPVSGMPDLWQQGVLMAASIVIAAHDMPVVAATILNELGAQTADCSSMDEFDKTSLRKAQGELGGAIALRGLALPSPRAPDTPIAPKCAKCDDAGGKEVEFSSTSGAWVPCPSCKSAAPLPAAPAPTDSLISILEEISVTDLAYKQRDLATKALDILAAPAPTEQQDELPITRSTYGSLEACEAEQARRNAAPTEQVGELPPLPRYGIPDEMGYTTQQMQDHARAAYAMGRASAVRDYVSLNDAALAALPAEQAGELPPLPTEAAAWVTPLRYGSKVTFPKPPKPEGWDDDEEEWYCNPLFSAKQMHAFRAARQTPSSLAAKGPVAGELYFCTLEHCVTGEARECMLLRVAEDDCDWRTADDHSEISNGWEVSAWRALAARLAPTDAPKKKAQPLTEQQMADMIKPEMLTDIGHRAMLNGERILLDLPWMTRFANFVLGARQAPAEVSKERGQPFTTAQLEMIEQEVQRRATECVKIMNRRDPDMNGFFNEIFGGVEQVPDSRDAWPEEPTPEMQAAGAQAIRFDTTTLNKMWTANAVYRAMRAAQEKAK